MQAECARQSSLRQFNGASRKGFYEVDLLVNNARVARESYFEKGVDRAVKSAINVNLNSLFNMRCPAIVGLRERYFNSAVCVGSIKDRKERRVRRAASSQMRTSPDL